MIFRSLKWGLAVATGAILVGGLLFGRDVASYVHTGVRHVQHVAKEAIPIDVELERARRLIQDIMPELKANVRVIAQEEVEVAYLRKQIEGARENVASQRHQVSLLRDRLNTQMVSIEVGKRTMSRDQVVERLASRLERCRSAETELTTKQQLLETREHSLAAARDMLDKSRARKTDLEQKIEALVAKHRLVRAQAIASQVHIDDSQLARADRLMLDIEKRLEAAQRVLSYEADLVVDDNYEEAVSEDELLAEVDDYLMRSSDAELIVALGEAEVDLD